MPHRVRAGLDYFLGCFLRLPFSAVIIMVGILLCKIKKARIAAPGLSRFTGCDAGLLIFSHLREGRISWNPELSRASVRQNGRGVSSGI